MFMLMMWCLRLIIIMIIISSGLQGTVADTVMRLLLLNPLLSASVTMHRSLFVSGHGRGYQVVQLMPKAPHTT